MSNIKLFESKQIRAVWSETDETSHANKSAHRGMIIHGEFHVTRKN